MKNEKGITLIVLIITIVLMIIIAGTAISYGGDSLKAVKLQNFRYELEQVQGKVDTIFEKIKLGSEEYILLGNEITESEEAMNTLTIAKDINYSNILDTERDKYYYQDNFSYYRYLTQSDIQEIFNITSKPGDMIINFKTREVISVEGFEYDGRTYYTLDELN